MSAPGYLRFAEIVGPQTVDTVSVFVHEVKLLRYCTDERSHGQDSCLLVLQDGSELAVNALMGDVERRLSQARLDWQTALEVAAARRIVGGAK